jgi:hypothetical protein
MSLVGWICSIALLLTVVGILASFQRVGWSWSRLMQRNRGESMEQDSDQALLLKIYWAVCGCLVIGSLFVAIAVTFGLLE